MSEEIIKVLDNLGERFGIAIDWTSQNVMPYVQDLLGRFMAYRNATAIIQIIISIILIIARNYYDKENNKMEKRKKYRFI